MRKQHKDLLVIPVLSVLGPEIMIHGVDLDPTCVSPRRRRDESCDSFLGIKEQPWIS